MIKPFDSRRMRKRRHRRVRMRLSGTAERPRLSVFRSTMHIYAQIIDDSAGRTLVQASSLDKDIATIEPAVLAPASPPGNAQREKGSKPAKGDRPPVEPAAPSRRLRVAQQVGTLLARRAQEKGIKKVVFDRGGYLYHGRIKALADAARAAGLEF